MGEKQRKSYDDKIERNVASDIHRNLALVQIEVDLLLMEA
jgi:hypothetical protein